MYSYEKFLSDSSDDHPKYADGIVVPNKYTEAVKKARKDAERAVGHYEVLKALETDEKNTYKEEKQT
jgi:hypothetical protein